MSEVKWIKIMTNLFDNRKIRLIEKLPEGDAVVVIWVKILCLAGSINEDGRLIFTNEIPYTDELLAAQFEKPINTIRLALRTFQQFEMIEIIDNIICVSNWAKYQNLEGMERIREQARERKRRQRERERLALIEKKEESHVKSRDSHATEEDKEEDKNINILSSKVEDVINYLNEKTGKSFKSTTASTKKHISGRLNEGYSLEDFKRVIDVKTNQWLKDEKMSKYLRPDTLFSPGHFESYLNEAPKPKPVVKEEKKTEKIDLEWQRQFYDDEDEWNQQVEEWRKQGLV